MLKSLVGSVLRRMGYQAVRTESLKSIAFTLQLRRIFDTQKIDTVFDVGANRGQFRDYLRGEVGFRGRILSFEPISKLHQALTTRAERDPLWQVYPCALGDADGTLSINVMAADDFSSFLTPSVAGTERFRESNAVAAAETVQVRTLDAVFAEAKATYGIGRCHLKLDTQGYDIKALRGGEKVLPQVVSLQTEASVIPLYEGSPSYQDTIAYLKAHGFELAGLSPITYDERHRLIEFDCLAVNTAQATAAVVEKR
jgi:FkbM family methyltransferase